MTPQMLNLQRFFLVLAGISLLAACSTSPPKPEVDFKSDYDFAAVHKIAFYDESGLVSGNNPIPLSDMQRERVDTALEQALGKKGYEILDQQNAAKADLLISWNLITNDKTDVRTYQTPSMGVGYGRYGGYNGYSMYNCWGCSQTEVSVRNYTEGTFIVDLIDPKLKRSVWRSLVQSRLKGDGKATQADFNAAADRVLAAFPPP